jgi:hypothetical protein
MRKISLILAFVAATIAVNAQEGKMNAIKINPLSLAVLTGNIAYEHAIGPKSTVQLGAFYSGASFGGTKYAGWGVTPEFRYYLSGEAMNGFYAAPFARYQSFSITDKEADLKTTLTTMGGGALIGYEHMANSGFTFDIFAGPSYNKTKFKNDSDEDNFDVKAAGSGFGVRFGLTLGFGF